MKSTYKILSSHLDGKPLAMNVPVKVRSSDYENLFSVDAELNLFDFPHCRRVLLGSELLTDNLSVISHQIDMLDNIEEIVIKIDYCSPLAITNRLYLKRIFQAIGQLQQNHPNVTYIIAVEEGKVGIIKTMCEQIQSSTEKKRE